jgi:uncharacterized protein
LILISFSVGLLIGLTSLGSGTLMTPSLILVAGMSPSLAVGTGLAFGSMTKLIAAGMHWRQRTVDLRVVGRLAIGSIPGSLLGVWTMRHLRLGELQGETQIRHALAIVLLGVSILILLTSAGVRLPRSWPGAIRQAAPIGLVPLGAFVGFLVGLTSVGSGSLITPFLLLLYPQQPSRAVGTDVFHAALLATVTAALHWNIGNVNWAVVPLLALGSIPGVVLGSRLAPLLPGRALRICLGLVLLISGWKLL